MKNISYISAGAGSGKTTKLVSELVRAIQEQHFSPSSIIMTTFTKAAAQEMRERARKELMDAGEAEKASELDAAAIGTIHSVCLNFLKRFWYLVPISPNPKELEDNDFKMYTNRSINQIVKEEQIQQLEAWRAELKIVHNKNEDDVDYWRNMLRTMIEKVRYYNIDIKRSKAFSLQEIDNLWKANAFSQNRYNQLTEQYIEALPTKKDGELTDAAQKRRQLLTVFDPSNPDPNIFSSLSGNLTNFEKVGFDISQWIAEVNKNTFSPNLKTILTGITEMLFDILIQWKDNYQKFKAENHLLDFNDMELYFSELLDRPQVQDQIRAQYKMILVDEFQDCNHIQVEIFSKLSELVQYSIWVGDPKQAIYGFRGSDTELVQSVSREIRKKAEAKEDGFSTEELPDSYRSRPLLVDFANSIFVPLFTQPRFGLQENEIKLNYGRLPSQEDPFDKQENTVEYVSAEGKNKSLQIAALAQKIRTLHNHHTWKNIALLVRGNSMVRTIVYELRKQGIPAASPEMDIFPRAEVQLLIAMLQYCMGKRYRTHLRADILHLLRGESTESLLNSYMDAQNEDWRMDDEIISCMEQIAKDMYHKPTHDILSACVQRLRLYDIVAQWGEADTRRNNINTMLRIAAQFDTHCLQMEEENVRFSLFTQYLIDSGLTPTNNLDSNAVQVMTIHKAKGLQWPVVVLYELNNENLSKEHLVKREFCGIRELKTDSGDYLLRVFPPIGKHLTSINNHIAQMPFYLDAKERITKEEARLFYVGATRAQDLLVIASSAKRTAWLDAMELPVFNPVWEEVTAQAIGEIEKETFTLIDTTATRHTAAKDANGRILSAHINPSKARVPAERPTVTQTQLSIPPFQTFTGEAADDQQQIRQNLLGTCIHNIYASFVPELSDEQAIEKANDIISSFGFSPVLDTAAVVAAIRALYQYLTQTYGPAIRITHEVPFSAPTSDGQVIRGDIDLLWYTNPDSCVLVDFKNISGDTPHPENYYGQMAAYQSALQAAHITCQSVVLFYASLGIVVTLQNC